MNKVISIGLAFGGVVLPIVESKDGFQRVPLKPICDVVGVDWEHQRKKVQGGYLSRRLGVCPEGAFWAGQMREIVMIRIDRVVAFLNSLNPDLIRVTGNADSADWLEAKHQEWDDVLHAWENGFRAESTAKMAENIRISAAITRAAAIKHPVLQRLALEKLGIDLDSLVAESDIAQGDLFKKTG